MGSLAIREGVFAKVLQKVCGKFVEICKNSVYCARKECGNSVEVAEILQLCKVVRESLNGGLANSPILIQCLRCHFWTPPRPHPQTFPNFAAFANLREKIWTKAPKPGNLVNPGF